MLEMLLFARLSWNLGGELQSQEVEDNQPLNEKYLPAIVETAAKIFSCFYVFLLYHYVDSNIYRLAMH